MWVTTLHARWWLKWVMLGHWTIRGPLRAGRGTRENPLAIDDILPLCQMLAELEDLKVAGGSETTP
jgi:hypothetical protein